MICAEAPSNIALIKYMGKIDSAQNLPANRSLSLTLNRLRTRAVAQESDGSKGDLVWESQSAPEGFLESTLKAEGLRKLSRFLDRLGNVLPPVLSRLGFDVVKRPLLLSSWNNFPAEAGIASSASAFAALTSAVAAAWVRDPTKFESAWTEGLIQAELAQIARLGSGSSIRSFMGPWVLWEGEGVRPVEASTNEWDDTILLLQGTSKEVSSSEAHRRVLTSPHWVGRVERAEERIEEFSKALRAGDWSTCARISWQEAWDMHTLFHTSWPPFGYMNGRCLDVLRTLSIPVSEGAAWFVTLDAGPNIHIVTPRLETARLRSFLDSKFSDLRRLEDSTSEGAGIFYGI